MSNLTFDHRLLKEHTPESLEGHAVVVFIRVGEAGEGFHSILLPGAAPVKKGLPIPFRKQPEYFAYAVDIAPQRHLEFSESMRLADHVSEFRVVFNLTYAVADPRALARSRNADPLRKVRDQVRAVVKRKVEPLPWQALLEFPQHARDVVNDCMDELREFAAPYGIAVLSLRLTVGLAEMVEASLSMIGTDPFDRRVLMQESARIEGALYGCGEDAVRRGDRAIASRTGGLPALVDHVVAVTGAVRVRAQRQTLRSALLHMAAELLVDESGDGAATLRYAERARAVIAMLDPVPCGLEYDALMALADPEFALRMVDGENVPALQPGTELNSTVLLGGTAPSQAQPADVVLVQFAAYVSAVETHAGQVLAESAAPSDMIFRNIQTNCHWAVGARVSVYCRAEGLVVRMPMREFVWNGKHSTVQFDIQVPPDAHPQKSTIVIEAYVHDRPDSLDAVQVAQLRMPIQIVAHTPVATAPPQTVEVRAPRTAFASYASEDRIDVLARVSSIRQSAGLEVFMDVVDLRMGDQWNPEISRRILGSDRFLLFWSEKSANSKWVKWEWEQAIATKGDDVLELHLLRLTPIELVPEVLRKFNFNDVYIQLRDAETYRRELQAKQVATAGQPISQARPS